MPRHPQDLTGGSGSIPFLRGDRVTDIAVLKPGDLLIEDSHAFDATNVVLITRLDGAPLFRTDICYGKFVDPEDPTITRQNAHDDGFSIWDWQLEKDRFWRAVPMPVPQMCLANFKLTNE